MMRGFPGEDKRDLRELNDETLGAAGDENAEVARYGDAILRGDFAVQFDAQPIKQRGRDLPHPRRGEKVIEHRFAIRHEHGILIPPDLDVRECRLELIVASLQAKTL